ncbi:MAG: hypothetical protein ACOY3P_12105 [Planctomycetota bacterium]
MQPRFKGLDQMGVPFPEMLAGSAAENGGVRAFQPKRESQELLLAGDTAACW